MKCPICKSSNTRPFLIEGGNLRQDCFGVGVLTCPDCNFLFADFIHPQVLDYYYNHICRSEMAEEAFQNIRESGRANARSQLISLEPYLPDRIGRVLDFGGGTGEMARLFLSKADEVYVVESDPKCIAVMKEEPRLQVIEGNSLTDEKFIGFFDLVIFSNVLEHMTHPVRRIQEFSRILSKDGQLFVEVPNEGTSVAQTGWYCAQHICYYTMDTFRKLIEVQGSFDIENIRTSGAKLEDILASGFLLHDFEAQDTPNGYEIRAVLKNNRPNTEIIDMNIDMDELDSTLASLAAYVYEMTHARN